MKTYKEIIEQVEKDVFEHTLSECQYNIAKTARVLKISRGTLNYKLKQYFGAKYVTTKNSK